MEAGEDLELAWHSVFLGFVFVDGSKSPKQCEHALHSNDPSSVKKNYILVNLFVQLRRKDLNVRKAKINEMIPILFIYLFFAAFK